jgi:hypothetical protein
MRPLVDLILGSPQLDDRSLVLHLVVKALVVTVVLLVLAGLEFQADVVYEAF